MKVNRTILTPARFLCTVSWESSLAPSSRPTSLSNISLSISNICLPVAPSSLCSVLQQHQGATRALRWFLYESQIITMKDQRDDAVIDVFK